MRMKIITIYSLTFYHILMIISRLWQCFFLDFLNNLWYVVVLGKAGEHNDHT